MPVAKTDNLNIYYEIIGQGQPLVMIRGVGSNVDHWFRFYPKNINSWSLTIAGLPARLIPEALFPPRTWPQTLPH